MKLKPLNKKGQLGMNAVINVAIAFLILVVVSIAVILAGTSLRDSGIFTADSQEDNDTTHIVGNVSGGLVDFFGNTTTIFSILVVVVIILAIAIIVGAVKRFGSNSGGL